MRDLSTDDAHLGKRLNHLFKLIGAEGLFVFGIGVGWTLALFSLKVPLTPITLFLLGAGALLILASAAIFFWRANLMKSTSNFLSFSPIDLRNSLRAFRIHGSQVPLIKRGNFRSEFLCLSKSESILLPENHRFVVEHWRGPDVEIQFAQGSALISAEQVLFFDSRQLNRWEKRKMRLPLVLNETRADEDLVLVLHIIPQEV